MDKMKGNRVCYLVVIFLQIVMSWVCATSSSRPFALHDDAVVASFAHVHQPLGAGAGSDQSHHTSETNLSTKEVNNMTTSSSNEAAAATSLKGEVEGLAVAVARIGSSPPNCEHKCYGCIPCEPTQVPTTHAHVGIQDANYEPEGWKCKCGPSFYIP